jgi:hypothetical protein
MTTMAPTDESKIPITGKSTKDIIFLIWIYKTTHRGVINPTQISEIWYNVL